MQSKTCRMCGVEKPLDSFVRNYNYPDGKSRRCKACDKQYREANSSLVKKGIANWRKQNKQKILEYNRQYRATHSEWVKDYARKYREDRPEYFQNYQQVYQKRNADRLAVAKQKYRRQNAGTVNAVNANRRARLLRATPGWFSDFDNFALREAYQLRILRKETTGIDWHVDHIIPLQAKQVCGLHIAKNLAVIPAETNMRKRNCFDELKAQGE